MMQCALFVTCPPALLNPGSAPGHVTNSVCPYLSGYWIDTAKVNRQYEYAKNHSFPPVSKLVAVTSLHLHITVLQTIFGAFQKCNSLLDSQAGINTERWKDGQTDTQWP